MAHRLSDANNMYAWLDPHKYATQPENDLSSLLKPYTFTDFAREWDSPDDSEFEAWCQQIPKGRKENIAPSIACCNRYQAAAKKVAAGICCAKSNRASSPQARLSDVRCSSIDRGVPPELIKS